MESSPLKILHVFRAPLGGLFRHVVDLVEGQAERGHQVGIVADSTTGGTRADETFARLSATLSMGISRFPIGRQLGPGDIGAVLHVNRRVRETKPDVIHGHGAKGAAYARLAAPFDAAVRAYTPHGGSLLYRPGTMGSRFYVGLETILKPRTDLFLFESAYSRDIYYDKVGRPEGVVRVVLNGVGPSDFEPVPLAADATDIVFVGELRSVKGIDVLLRAIASLRANGMQLGAAIVGGGPDRESLEALSKELGLDGAVTFHGPLPARQAFSLGRLMVVPSRAESLPYIVLEAAAAGLPLIATDVGGVSEIFGPLSDRLIAADDSTVLAASIKTAVNDLESMRIAAAQLRTRVAQKMSVDSMVEGIIGGYREAIGKQENSNSQ